MPSIGYGGTHKSNRESEILNEAEIGSYHLVEDIVKDLTYTNAKQAQLSGKQDKYSRRCHKQKLIAKLALAGNADLSVNAVEGASQDHNVWTEY
jgi:hypothetical protein